MAQDTVGRPARRPQLPGRRPGLIPERGRAARRPPFACCRVAVALWRRRERPDVRVAEGRRAVLLRRRRRHGVSPGRERLPPGVDRRAVGGVAGVVPDGRAVGRAWPRRRRSRRGTRRRGCSGSSRAGRRARRGGARVKAPVGAARSRRRRAARRPRATRGSPVVGLVRRRERVVDDVDVRAVRRDRRRRVVAAVAGASRSAAASTSCRRRRSTR